MGIYVWVYMYEYVYKRFCVWIYVYIWVCVLIYMHGFIRVQMTSFALWLMQSYVHYLWTCVERKNCHGLCQGEGYSWSAGKSDGAILTRLLLCLWLFMNIHKYMCMYVYMLIYVICIYAWLLVYALIIECSDACPSMDVMCAHAHVSIFYCMFMLLLWDYVDDDDGDNVNHILCTFVRYVCICACMGVWIWTHLCECVFVYVNTCKAVLILSQTYGWHHHHHHQHHHH